MWNLPDQQADAALCGARRSRFDFQHKDVVPGLSTDLVHDPRKKLSRNILYSRVSTRF